MIDTSRLIPDLRTLCAEAGEAIMQVYQRPDFDVQAKGDNSPVTAADLAAHEVIRAGLERLSPAIPQLSEEDATITHDQRRQWPLFWCIDPLDGTKEFIRRNDEFTVNIALIDQGRPILGIIHLPPAGITYWGGPTIGAWKQQGDGPVEAIHCRKAEQALVMTGSRRHGQEQNAALLERLSSRYTQVRYQPGGSSLKMCLIAEGSADLYPRLYPTCEWDTAAAQAILEAAGGVLINAETLKPLTYNQRESLINPHFYAAGDPAFPFELLNPC